MNFEEQIIAEFSPCKKNYQPSAHETTWWQIKSVSFQLFLLLYKNIWKSLQTLVDSTWLLLDVVTLWRFLWSQNAVNWVNDARDINLLWGSNLFDFLHDFFDVLKVINNCLVFIWKFMKKLFKLLPQP